MTQNKAEIVEKYKGILLMEETSHQELVDLNGDLPSDTHLVTYELFEDIATSPTKYCYDAVRAYKMSDIFDAYHELGVVVHSIKSGYGACKPKLWVDSTVAAK